MKIHYSPLNLIFLSLFFIMLSFNPDCSAQENTLLEIPVPTSFDRFYDEANLEFLAGQYDDVIFYFDENLNEENPEEEDGGISFMVASGVTIKFNIENKKGSLRREGDLPISIKINSAEDKYSINMIYPMGEGELNGEVIALTENHFRILYLNPQNKWVVDEYEKIK